MESDRMIEFKLLIRYSFGYRVSRMFSVMILKIMIVNMIKKLLIFISPSGELFILL